MIYVKYLKKDQLLSPRTYNYVFRLEDILGIDSGSDKDYKPEIKKKKRKIYPDPKANS